MSELDIRAILRAYLLDRLKQLRAKHLATPYDQPVHAVEVDYPYDVWAVRQADLSAIDQAIRLQQRDLRYRDARAVEHTADELANGHQLSPEQRTDLALGVLKAEIQLLQQSRKWLTHGLVEEITPQVLSPTAAPSVQPSHNVSDAAEGPKLSEVLPAFTELMVKEEGWRGQTLAQNEATYRMFLECCGDRPPSQYQRKDLAKFYDLLRGLPSLYSKGKERSQLSLAEIVERTKHAEHPRLTMKTIKRHFSALGRLFSYLKRRGEYDGENPAHGFEFPDKRRAREKRGMWEGETLTKLFASPVWTGCASSVRRSKPGPLIIKDEKFWLPILGLFHGNRLEEFAQLRRKDVQCSGGTWFLDINDEDDKQVKNEQSKRRVPIHPRVQQLGFLEYVESTSPSANDQVFPNLRPGGADKKLGFTFTKWWSRYRQDVGLYKKGLDYHSFRHGVTTKLTAAGIPLEVRNELLGHEGKSTDERVYQKGLPLSVLAEAIEKVEWPEVAL
jgi:integrase